MVASTLAKALYIQVSDIISGDGWICSLPGGVTFTNEPCNDPRGCILLVEGIAELLSCSLMLLIANECLEHEGVPFILKRVEKGRD